MSKGESAATDAKKIELQREQLREQLRPGGEVIGCAVELFSKSIHNADAIGGVGNFKELPQFRMMTVGEDSRVVEQKAFGVLSSEGTTDFVCINRQAVDAKKMDVTGVTSGMHKNHAKHHASRLELTYRRGNQINPDYDTGIRITAENGVLIKIEDLRVVKWVTAYRGVYDQLDPQKFGPAFLDNWDRLAGILEVMKLRVES